MNFNELNTALRAQLAKQPAPGGSQTLAKAFPNAVERPTKALRVVSLRRSHVEPPLLKALGEVPNQKIKDAAVDSASRRREVPNADQLLGGGKRVYRVVYGGSSLTEEEARAACARAFMDSRVTADEAIRIEHYLNEHRTMPAALAAKLF